MDELQKKKLFEKRNKELQQDLVVLETKVKEKLKPVVKLSQKIAEENRKTLKPLIDDLEKSQQVMLKLNPFTQFLSQQAVASLRKTGGLLGKGRNRKANQSLLSQGTGIMSLLDRPAGGRLKPVGASRKPSMIQVGLNSYMTKHGLKNPVDFAKAYKKHKDYKIYGYINLRMILEEMNSKK